MELIETLGPWKWFIFGLFLLGLEVLAPGWVFLWFGVAAFIVGGLGFFVELSWQSSILIFISFSLIAIILGRRITNRGGSDSDDPALNKRGARYIGQEYVLAEPIEQGRGTLRIDDTIWRIVGPDLPAGALVRVVAVKGVALAVKKAGEA
ncbi:NfeD family protein [Rhodobacteraceae bacterium RKSG542]|nr:NfeD family protein [Pseudovibrio flavus]